MIITKHIQVLCYAFLCLIRYKLRFKNYKVFASEYIIAKTPINRVRKRMRVVFVFRECALITLYIQKTKNGAGCARSKNKKKVRAKGGRVLKIGVRVRVKELQSECERMRRKGVITSGGKKGKQCVHYVSRLQYSFLLNFRRVDRSQKPKGTTETGHVKYQYKNNEAKKTRVYKFQREKKIGRAI